MTDNFSTNFSGMFYDPSAAEYYWTQNQVHPKVTLSKTPFTYQTPDIITGTIIGDQSNIGDLLLDVWIDVVTPWVGSVNGIPWSSPFLGTTYLPVEDISPFYKDLQGNTFDMSLTDIINGGLIDGLNYSPSGLSIPQQSYGKIYSPGTFTNLVSCHVSVNSSGQPDTVDFTNDPTTLTSGSAILNVLTLKQNQEN